MKTIGVVLCGFLGVVVLGSRAVGAEPQPPAQERGEPKLTIVNVASHCDWSWNHTRAWHEDRYAEMIRAYLGIMRQDPKFVWQLETVNEQLLPFLAKAERNWPELIDELWKGIQDGRIEVINAYSNPRLSEVYPELFVRSLVLGKEYFQRHAPGVKQEVFEVSDLMCGTSQTPQILAQAGYRYFMFTRPVSQQAVFWRRGLDGTRMLNCKDVYGYPELQGKPGATFPGIQPVPVWRYAIGTDDMSPDPAAIAKILAEDPKNRVLSTIRRFFQECEKYSDQLTELSGSLDSCNHYNMAGMHGNANIHTQNNQNEDFLLSLEKAQAVAAMLGRSGYDQPADELWREALSCTGHAIEWSWKEDYAERMAQGRHTREKARRYLEDALCAVGSAIPFATQHGTPLVVFNLHSWPVSGPVQVAIDNGAEGLVLRDSEGKVVPLQWLGEDTERGPQVAFSADHVPALGFKTYYVSRAAEGGLAKTPAKVGSPKIENELYRITAAANGRLEVFDKTRNTVLGAPQVGGLGDVVIYDLPPSIDSWVHNGPAGQRRDWLPAMDRCQVTEGPVFSSLRIPGTIGPHAITREVRLWHNSPRIEFGVECDTQQQDNAILCIRFPVGVTGNVVAGIPFGVESRDNLDKEPFRCEMFAAGFPEGYDGTRWTDVSTAESGYTFICPPGMHTGYAFKKADQSLEFILNRFQPMPKDYFARAALSVEGKGHNQWWCALLPHAGTWREAGSYRHALEQHVPLLAWSTARGLGRSGASLMVELNKPDRPQRDGAAPVAIGAEGSASLVEVLPANVVLSSLRLVHSGKPGGASEYELRLYETAGRASDVVIRLARPVATAERTNFLGEAAGESGGVQIAGNELRLHVEPWKIVTLRIKDR